MLKRIKKVKITKPVPFAKLIPNVITLFGLIIGVSSIKFALDNNWERGVYCILIAAILDGTDGRIARLLNATSSFGAELDSLCDFVNFGLCPPILIYVWSFQQFEFKLLSWFAMLLFVSCMAIRLARFNTDVIQNKIDPKSKYFATGVPAPSGALLALLPMILDFDIAPMFYVKLRPYTMFIDLYIILIAILLASRVPTFLFKNLYIKPEYLSLFMIGFTLVFINLIIYPWYTLPILGLIYICSMPISIILVKKWYNYSE